jgi:hypothetical protein
VCGGEEGVCYGVGVCWVVPVGARKGDEVCLLRCGADAVCGEEEGWRGGRGWC